MDYRTIIDARTAIALVASGDVAVFDCRFELTDPDAGAADHAREHIAGAQYLDLETDLSGPATGTNGRHPLPDRQMLAATLRTLGLRQGQQVIAYDDHEGPFAARLWWLLRWLGHDRVAVLDGGLSAWLAAGGPLARGEAKRGKPGDFTASAEPSLPTVTARDVEDGLAAGDRLLVDARAAERFRGEVAAFDPVPGHIPGARNRPYRDNVIDGRFKSGKVLATEFSAIIGSSEPSDLVLYCGSGVTACHNALALEIAGLPGASLYPGSWSEWSSQGDRHSGLLLVWRTPR
ncbi:sulfurtransferase [Sphingomonas sp.]|uniref:sulfurtransferase n=1 Tax=Sphingomonas sp. TaxID=28214 RepID=UPI002DD68F47|nr:sulfurtransferase [Sphingomonas sp.]